MNTLHQFVLQEREKQYCKDIEKTLQEERKNKVIYPAEKDVFSCFENIDQELKVVIIGQDPYHNPDQANGLAFSVSRQCQKLPPSLKNIYKELKDDLTDFTIPEHGNLSYWKQQGVLLLNTTLTVEKNKPASHYQIGWDHFTDEIVSHLNDHYDGLVFILWGKHAQNKCEQIDESKHYIIKSTHPSPFSAYRGFFGSKPFSKTNTYLIKINKKPIDWQI